AAGPRECVRRDQQRHRDRRHDHGQDTPHTATDRTTKFTGRQLTHKIKASAPNAPSNRSCPHAQGNLRLSPYRPPLGAMRTWSHRLRPPMIPPGRRSTIAGLVGVVAVVAVGLSMCGASASLRHATASGARAGTVKLGAGRQIAAALEARIDGETGGTLTTVHFYCKALRKQADYLVYLPAGYSAADRLPVFYMLHGMPGKP